MLCALIFIHEWWDLQFNVDSKRRQFYFTLWVFARNLLRGNRWRNIFHISFFWWLTGIRTPAFVTYKLTHSLLGHGDGLTLTQCRKLITTYYKIDDPATATYRALRRDYGLQNCSTTQVIVAKLWRKLKRLKWLQILNGLCIIVSLVPLKNIAIVSESIAEASNVLIPRRF